MSGGGASVAADIPDLFSGGPVLGGADAIGVVPGGDFSLGASPSVWDNLSSGLAKLPGALKDLNATAQKGQQQQDQQQKLQQLQQAQATRGQGNGLNALLQLLMQRQLQYQQATNPQTAQPVAPQRQVAGLLGY